jgi:hypothetical protein
MSPVKRRFAVASGLAPSADEVVAVQASGRQDATTPAGAVPSSQLRTAFTWRLTTEQGITFDTMMLRLKRELGRSKLDKAEMLAALVALADENPAVYGALVARLQADQAS